MKFRFEYNGSSEINLNIRSIIFRAIRELVIKIDKHAKAENVYIRVENNQRELIVIIEDDGVGFDIHQLSESDKILRGFGLFSIRQQLLYINGQILVESDVGLSTKVTLICPIKIIKEDIERELTNAGTYTYSRKPYCHV